jgi:malonyl-ACP decarboxylase
MSGGTAGADGVVVTGMGVLCAIASDLDEFEKALRRGDNGIAVRGDGEAGELEPWLAADLDGFEFAVAVRARAALPAAVRALALRVAGRAPMPVQASVTVALQAWDQAGLADRPVPAERVGIVVAGHNLGGRHAEAVRSRYAASPAHLAGRYALQFMDTDHVGTLSQILGATGEGYTVGGASASGNVAIVNGARLVAADAVDVCLVVGALTDLSMMERQAFYNLGAMAGSGGRDEPGRRCRPFDRAREGFVPGQGTACLVLESADSAARRRAPAVARIAGHASRLDGNSLADPSAAGEAWAMAEAIRRAGLSPDRIGYVNAHGTGSPLGDDTEVRALREVFGRHRPRVNSTKGLLGHCLCAAGVVEAVAAVVQMRGGFVHPNANLEVPIDPDCRFVGAAAEPAVFDYALSNSFGFGGFNTAVVLGRPKPHASPVEEDTP